MFRCPALPLRYCLKLCLREFRAVAPRSYHPILQPLFPTPVLPNAAVAFHGACALQFLPPGVSEPFAFASVFDEQPDIIFTTNIRDHLHALHCLSDCHSTYLRKVFCVRMPYGEACMHSRVNADKTDTLIMRNARHIHQLIYVYLDNNSKCCVSATLSLHQRLNTKLSLLPLISLAELQGYLGHRFAFRN